MRKITLLLVFCLNLLPYISDGKFEIGSGSTALAQSAGEEEVCEDEYGVTWESWNGCDEAEVCSCPNCYTERDDCDTPCNNIITCVFCGAQVPCRDYAWHICSRSCYCYDCGTEMPCDTYANHTCGGEGGSNPPPSNNDCAGVPNGGAYIDNCGNCVGGNTRSTPCTPSTPDCAGVLNGTAYRDNCGDCVGGTTGRAPCTPSTPDCAGVPNGMAYIDGCGVCVGGTTGMIPCVPCAGQRQCSVCNLYISPTSINCPPCYCAEKLFRVRGLTPEEVEKLNEAINDFFEDCLGKGMYNAVKSLLGNNNKIPIEFSSGGGGSLSPDWNNKFDSRITLGENSNSSSLLHELGHYCQILDEDEDSYEDSMLNLEMEAWYMKYDYLKRMAEKDESYKNELKELERSVLGINLKRLGRRYFDTNGDLQPKTNWWNNQLLSNEGLEKKLDNFLGSNLKSALENLEDTNGSYPYRDYDYNPNRKGTDNFERYKEFAKDC